MIKTVLLKANEEVTNFMKYTFLVWIFTVLISPFVLTLIIEDGLYSPEIIILMILFGGGYSIPAMLVFWLIQRTLKSKLEVWKIKTLLSLYSFLSVWTTFYIVYKNWTDEFDWVIAYSLIMILGTWLFKISNSKINN